ncbi:MAG: site-specific integrase [Phycisphaerales bacterium]|nr:site-specific integrase [Phycisphaerales bacterium]
MAKRQRHKGTGSIYKRSERGAWVISWIDHEGRRVERNTRTTDRATAERILRERLSEAALRRDGVIDPNQDRYSIEAKKPLNEHVSDYIQHCRRTGQAARHVDQKASHLERLISASGAKRLIDLAPDALEKHMALMRDDGLSARSVNFARQIAVAFVQWCVKTSKIPSNPLRVVPKLDETSDRRRVRRALTDEELGRLLEVARERGREAWYLAAALAGLRRGDLVRLTWSDIDFEQGVITIRGGKAKRVDQVPMHPQLEDALRDRLREARALPRAKVFSSAVTSRTQLLDFLRAGLAREEVVTDEQGKPIMVGQGKRQRPKTRIVTEDEDGRVIDLHALRTTLGTQLARAGVAPQIAQKIMRHGDYRTTLKHYTVLGLSDTSKAVGEIPSIKSPGSESQQATGTAEERPHSPQQLGRETQQLGAKPCAECSTAESQSAQHKTRSSAALSGSERALAKKRVIGIEPTTFSLGS